MALRITPEQRRQIARLDADGHTQAAIADRLGIDRHTVARHLGDAAVPDSARGGGLAGLSTAEGAVLRLLMASVVVVRCGECNAAIVQLRSMAAGMCPHCCASWKIEVG